MMSMFDVRGAPASQYLDTAVQKVEQGILKYLIFVILFDINLL